MTSPSTTHKDFTLNASHQALLDASAIDPEVAAARGYRSVGRAEARELGFTGAQARPGLLVPRCTLWGQDGYQLRPDEPRLDSKGKSIKYETPRGQSNRLDVHPWMHDRVRSPREVVFITEGARKADSLASIDIPAINLNGVTGWRGTNAHGGKTALDDWNDVAIAGSKFVLAFDADILTKPSVYKALKGLRGYLLARRAVQVLVLRLPADGPKGIDDWISARQAVQA